MQVISILVVALYGVAVDRGSGAAILWQISDRLRINVAYLGENTEFLTSNLFNSSSNPSLGLFSPIYGFADDGFDGAIDKATGDTYQFNFELVSYLQLRHLRALFLR